MRVGSLGVVAFLMSFGLAGVCAGGGVHRSPTIISDARDVDPSSIRRRDTDRSDISDRDTDRSGITKGDEDKDEYGIDRERGGREPRRALTPEARKRIEYYENEREAQEERKRRQGWYEDQRELERRIREQPERDVREQPQPQRFAR